MDRYIGLDVHASSCTLAVMMPGGKRLGSQVVETNARCLIETIRQIPEPRHICVEEGNERVSSGRDVCAFLRATLPIATVEGDPEAVADATMPEDIARSDDSRP